MRRLAADPGEAATRLLLAGFVLVVAVWPMARLLAELRLPLLASTWAEAGTLTALRNTLVTCGAGTVLSVLLGAGWAYALALTDIRGRGALAVGFLLPLMIAPQVLALAWSQAAGPGSALLAAFGVAPRPGSPNPLYSAEGIALVLGAHHAPLVFLAVRAVLRRLPRDVVEAAQSAGAGAPCVLRRVVLPFSAPALVAGAGLAFVSAIGNFGIPAMLGIPAGYPVLVTLIYRQLAGFGPSMLPQVAALGLGLGVLSALSLAIQARWQRRMPPLPGSARPAPPWALGAWRLPLELLLWGLLAALLLFPLAALLAQSLVPAIGVRLTAATVTLSNYADLLAGDGMVLRAFRNSTLLAAATAAVLLMAAIPLAVLEGLRRSRAIAVLSLCAEMPYALPGTVLSIAMILTFLRPVLGMGLYNTPWIILIAYLGRFLTLAWRPVSAGLAQIDRQIDEAASSAGAPFLRRLRAILAPLLAPSAAAGAILVFLTAFNELTVSALLWSSGNETVGVAVFSLEQGGDSAAAAAVAMLTVVGTVALMALASMLARRLPADVLPWRG